MFVAEKSAILLEAWWENLLTQYLYFTLGDLTSLFFNLIAVLSSERIECCSHYKRVNQFLLLMFLIYVPPLENSRL